METQIKKAYRQLSKENAAVVRETTTKLCKWKSTQTFYDKMSGRSLVSDKNRQGKNEVAIFENSFKAFGVIVWLEQPL